MFKKELGISIYPEKSSFTEIKNYILQAKKYHFSKVFMSWLQIKDEKKWTKLYQEVINFAKSHGFYVVLDICDNNFTFYQSLGVDCLRLDSPVLPKEVADFTYQSNLDVQLNISNNDSFINNVWDYQPVKENIYGCHNFYPQVNTGLAIDFFQSSTKRFNDLGIHVSAFINSHAGQYATQNFVLANGVTTIEKLRFKPIHCQAKILFATKQIDAIYIGNQFASEAEFKALAELDKKNVELDIELAAGVSALELEILNNVAHFSRGDINDKYIRSTMSRVYYKNREDIKPRTNHDFFVPLKKGDILIINSDDKNYQKELILITKEFINEFSDSEIALKANIIGHVKEYDLDLIDFIMPWQHFKFKTVNTVS